MSGVVGDSRPFPGHLDPGLRLLLDKKPPTRRRIAALETKIDQAPPREQCYLYAELIHQMTEFSLRQYSAGDVQKANALLKRVQQLAHKLHLSVGDNDKRLEECRNPAPSHRLSAQ